MDTEAGAADEAARRGPQEATPAPPGTADRRPGPAGLIDPAPPVSPDAVGTRPGPAEPLGPARLAQAAGPADTAEAVEPGDVGPGDPADRRGILALSPGYRFTAALALVAIGVVTCFHVLLVFLHVAPANTVSKQHAPLVDWWIYPEFEQNWKLFAPNPLQQNIAVQARAEVRGADGELRTTAWQDLSAQDGAAIDGNLLPSHTQQNELRRAWDIYTSTHDLQDRATGSRGVLSEQYLRRILVLRLDRLGVAGEGDIVERVQVRSRSTVIEPPKWSPEKVDQKPVYRQVPWWKVTARDASLDSGTHLRVVAETGGAR
ncbi:DUF5819 family protein [Streptomyces sp. NPDC046939]|uniref:DUF5819 family protein n=1 Tax=Streptomyces sp. NPDC046939 TaxID=3155376 RepID=UPI0033CC17B6